MYNSQYHKEKENLISSFKKKNAFSVLRTNSYKPNNMQSYGMHPSCKGKLQNANKSVGKQ